MFEIPFIEWIGYLASVIVAISLTMSSIIKLRILNLIGAFVFSVYGFIIGAYPVFGLNGFIVLINIYYLWGMIKNKDYFDILPTTENSAFFRFFEDHYAKDIHKFFPEYQFDSTRPYLTYITIRNARPIGILKGELQGTTLHVVVDFVIPEFRDFKTGHYLFHTNAGYFKDRGIETIAVESTQPQHQEYLKKMGFSYSEKERKYLLKL